MEGEELVFEEGGRTAARTSFARVYRRLGLRRAIRRRRYALMYHSMRAVMFGLRRLSLPHALALADRAGDLAYAAVPSVRRLALNHLEIAFGDTLSAADREAIARAVYRNTARGLTELIKLDEIRPHFDEYFSLEGLEHLQEVQALGRGGIVVTGHLGNPDLLAAYAGSKGIALAAIAKRLDDPRLDRILTDFRTSNGLHIIWRRSRRTGREILRVLKERRLLVIQIDNDLRTPSVSVPFFGRPTRTPAAAAVLAVHRDLPVLPAFTQRRPEGGHHFTVLPPIYPPKTGDRQRDVVELTRRFSEILEEQIRRNPSEWNWFHRRWRRRPIPGLDLDA